MASVIYSFGHRMHNVTHTHTHLTALCPGLPRSADTRKVKSIWILLKKEIVSGSGISWTICQSAPCSRQITMPAPHHSVFLQAGCPSCRPTNSVKALKAKDAQRYSGIYSVLGKSLKMLEFSIENSKEPMKVLELSPLSLAAVLKSSVLTLIPFFLVKRLLAVWLSSTKLRW